MADSEEQHARQPEETLALMTNAVEGKPEKAEEDQVRESLELASLKLREEASKVRNAETSRPPTPTPTETEALAAAATSETVTATLMTTPAQLKDETPMFSSTPARNPPGGGTTARELYRDAASRHGATESSALLQQEAVSAQKTRGLPAPTLDATISRNPSSVGAGGGGVGGKHEKKIGHRRVDEGGEVTYKRIQSKQIMGSIQLGIQHTVGGLASKPNRDLLMKDFYETETTPFPPDGSSITPAHHYSDFRFKAYAPIAFRFFRNLFGIAPDDFLISMCASPLRQLSNPGASGSIFYLTADDEFIIKTVQNKECEFLQKLLPGYYMNLSQNPRTLLPKFFGLYCFHYNTKNVRLVAMNNLLPSDIKMHAKYDLKGSTFGRKASKAERQKSAPTYKDLDFMEHHPNGIFLETETYNALIRTIQRDCRVLESFQIMDYSLLVGIHNLDTAAKEKREERIRNARAKLQRSDDHVIDEAAMSDVEQPAMPKVASTGSIAGAGAAGSSANVALNRTRSMNRQRLVAHSTALESIHADIDMTIEEDDEVPAGGIPARSENDERLILFIGIIDILQSYRLEKKLEHAFKSLIHNGDTVSVCKPSFYAERFQNFMGKTVFKKTPTFPLKHSPSRRKPSTLTLRTPQRPSLPGSAAGRPPLLTSMSGMSTPPPAFDDISEEDSTALTLQRRQLRTAPSSYVSSNRSVLSSDDFTDDDDDASLASSYARQRQRVARRTPKLTKTSVQVAAFGGIVVENGQVEPPEQHGAVTTTTTYVKSQTVAQTYKTTLVLDNS